MYRNYNANPMLRRGDDCTVRAISTVLNKTWDEVYCSLCEYGRYEYDMPTSNHVWGKYLTDEGYTRHIVPNSCPHCYTVRDFASDHKNGKYILALHGHVVACMNGDYFDSWDSGDEVVIYYWKKGE